MVPVKFVAVKPGSHIREKLLPYGLETVGKSRVPLVIVKSDASHRISIREISSLMLGEMISATTFGGLKLKATSTHSRSKGGVHISKFANGDLAWEIKVFPNTMPFGML